MIKSFVLFVYITNTQVTGTAVTSTKFNTQEACEYASKEIPRKLGAGWMIKVNAFCLPVG